MRFEFEKAIAAVKKQFEDEVSVAESNKIDILNQMATLGTQVKVIEKRNGRLNKFMFVIVLIFVCVLIHNP
jgi:hypothetical protein